MIFFIASDLREKQKSVEILFTLLKISIQELAIQSIYNS